MPRDTWFTRGDEKRIGLQNKVFTWLPYWWEIYPPLKFTSKLLVKCAFTRAVCKIRGLTLLLRVGNLWRCGDGLFFEVHPLASNALLTTLHPLLANR
jgi:hypothetical protein